MQVLKITAVSDYVLRLEHQEEEVRVLFRDLLIGVTAFFRDPEAFDSLRQNILPTLFENRSAGDVVRIWVAGCASGQEAYTMAILCREVMDELGLAGSINENESVAGTAESAPATPTVQIFATDIDERALAVARTGTYPVGIEEQVSPERLKRFFIKKGNRYHVSKEVRDMVLFSVHNLISDPPFSRQDLISCRNLLIYLGPHLQKKLIPLFHYALRPGGFLFLGPSESITTHTELFRTLDTPARLSQRKGTSIGNTGARQYRPGRAAPRADNDTQPDTATDLSEMRQRITLDEFSPKSVVINEDGQILNASPDMQKYLTVSGGNYHNDIIKMAARGLRIGLRAALAEAKKISRRVDHDDLSIRVGDLVQRVMITVQPMPRLGEDERLFLVVFHDVGKPFKRDALNQGDGHQKLALHDDPSTLLPDSTSADSIILQLERELEATREDLERTLQDIDASNEELKSSNEELLSMNEELQSANEELETSKEEIRASGEAIARANDDLENLLRSTQIATLFLDEEQRIRSFTPAVLEIYDLIPTDIGRPLERFVPLVHDMPPLPDPDDVMRSDNLFVSDTESPSGVNGVEHMVRAHSGKSYIRRVLPYRTHAGTAQGVVVTFVEVTKLHDSEELFQLLVDASAQIVWVTSADGVVKEDSPSWRAFTGQTLEEWLGFGWANAIHVDDAAETIRCWRASVESAEPFSMEFRLWHYDSQEYRWTQVRAVPHRYPDGRIKRWVGMNTDINDRKASEQKLLASEELVRTIAENSTQAMVMMSENGYVTYCNQVLLDLTGYTREEISSAPLHDLVHHHYPDGRPYPITQCPINRALPENNSFRTHEDVFFRKDGSSFEVSCAATPIHKAGGADSTVIEVRDITEQNAAKRELENREAHLRRVINHQLGLVGVLDCEGNLLEVDDNSLEIGRIRREDVIGKPFAEAPWWNYDRAVEQQVKEAIARAMTGEVVRYDVSLFAHGDEGVMIDFMIAPVIGDDGNIEYLIPSGVDIRDRKLAEKEMIDRENRLKLALSAGRMGTFTWLLASDTLIWSEEVFEILGCDPQQFTGESSNYFVVIHPDDRAHVQASLQAEFESRATEHRIEARVVRPRDQRTIWIQGHGRIEYDASGAPETVVGVISDVTQRKMIEQELEGRESHLRRVIDHMIGFVGVLDTDGILLEANATALIGGGLNRQDVIGRPFWDCFWWNHDEHVRLQLREAFRKAVTGEVIRYDVEIRMAGDTRLAIDFMMMPVRDHDGKVTHVIPSGMDISARKQYELDLKLSAQRLQTAAQATGFAALSVNLRTGSIELSPEFNRIVGCSEDHVFELRLGDVPPFVHPDDSELLLRHYHDARNSNHDGDTVGCDYRILRPDGEIRWARLRTKTLFSDKGEPTQIIGTLLDITQQHEIEEELKQARDRAEAATESKSEFLANMSHEIRTPMSAILGYADILAQHLNDPDDLNCVSIIRSNGYFLLDIINDILDISKIEAGKIEFSKKTFHLDQLIYDVQSLMNVRAVERGISFSVHADGPIPEKIKTDSKRLKQILINLIGNAIKFTESGYVKLVVRYLATAESSKIQFEIIDTGIGISEQDQHKLFQSFSQADASLNRSFGGTGLGLMISQRLAEMLGGGIEVQSTLGVGSTFSLTIGLGRTKNTAMIEHLAADQLVAPTQIPVATPTRLSGRFLVVDDRREIRFIAQHFIEDAGGTVTVGENGHDAIEAVEAAELAGQPFDLLVIDMQMPVLSGYEAVRRLRADGYDKPIIALTAHAMDGDREACIAAGCTDYIAKPLKGTAFVKLLHACLGGVADFAPLKRRRILIVDDGRQAAEAMCRLLEKKGHEVRVAFDGESGIEVARGFTPEILLLDLGLPDMTGFEALEILRDIPALAATRFVAATGQANHAETSAAGFHHHMVKPIAIHELEAWLNKISQ